ncbi:MAG: hypothetical protein U1B77_01060 [Dehalococcoidales bacterium]|nr:hypothetical protein [Dehalococcoidales bacterium]
MQFLALLIVSVIFFFLLFMYIAVVVLRPGRLGLHAWAKVTAVLIIFWGAVLFIESVWWFWDLLPPQLHSVVMLLGGLFGIYWGALYIFQLRKKYGKVGSL